MATLSQLLTQSHSALLEELRARFLDEAIELGLPKRVVSWDAVDLQVRLIIGGKIPSGETLLVSTYETQDAEQSTEILANVFRILGVFDATRPPGVMTDPRNTVIPNCIIWMPIFLPERQERYDLGILA